MGCHGWVGGCTHELTLENEGLFMPLKAKEAGINPWPHTTSPLSRAHPHTLRFGSGSPTSCSQENMWLPGKDNVITTLPPWRRQLVLTRRSWSNLLDQAEKSAVNPPTFTEKDRKGDQPTMGAFSTLEDPCLQKDADALKYSENEFSEEIQIGKLGIWKQRKHANAFP